MAVPSELANQTHLIEDAAHPVKENLEEVALEERHVQVALLHGLGVAPPVPALADAAIIPELQRTNHRALLTNSTVCQETMNTSKN